MNKFDRAVKYLENEYKKAIKQERIKNPLAYALYHTWRKFDK